MTYLSPVTLLISPLSWVIVLTLIISVNFILGFLVVTKKEKKWKMYFINYLLGSLFFSISSIYNVIIISFTGISDLSDGFDKFIANQLLFIIINGVALIITSVITYIIVYRLQRRVVYLLPSVGIFLVLLLHLFFVAFTNKAYIERYNREYRSFAKKVTSEQYVFKEIITKTDTEMLHIVFSLTGSLEGTYQLAVLINADSTQPDCTVKSVEVEINNVTKKSIDYAIPWKDVFACILYQKTKTEIPDMDLGGSTVVTVRLAYKDTAVGLTTDKNSKTMLLSDIIDWQDTGSEFVIKNKNGMILKKLDYSEISYL